MYTMSPVEKRKKARNLLRDARNMRAHGLISEDEFNLIVSSILLSEMDAYLEPRIRDQNSRIQDMLDQTSERLSTLAHADSL